MAKIIKLKNTDFICHDYLRSRISFLDAVKRCHDPEEVVEIVNILTEAGALSSYEYNSTMYELYRNGELERIARGSEYVVDPESFMGEENE